MRLRTETNIPQQVFNDKLYEIYFRFLETEDEYFDYAPAKMPPQGRWRIYGINLAGPDSKQGVSRECRAAVADIDATLLLIFCALLGFDHSVGSEVLAQVRVWQGTMTLPTYEEGLPDPNPPFDQFAGNKFNYPYVLRENLTSHRANHRWRAVYLENEYLKCSVLPDIGGHLYTCTDKISGQSMFYANSSIKKAAVGYRGAWAAFGVEFNFPVSHNWVSMSPVDFAFRKNDDASASVIVGNIDRVYGMQWQVELVLRPKVNIAGRARHTEQSQRCAPSFLLVE